MLLMLPTVALPTDATSALICEVMLATADCADLITCQRMPQRERQAADTALTLARTSERLLDC